MVANYIDVDIAKHCDKYKLDIAEGNALQYDMHPLMCNIEKNLEGINDNDPIYVGGKVGIYDFGGLNRIFGLYAYARYVENSIYVDTGSGLVRKDHSNSFPVQLNEVKDIAQQHRTMAMAEWDKLNAYICSQNTSSACSCSGTYCGSRKRNTTLTQRKGYNVTRR